MYIFILGVDRTTSSTSTSQTPVMSSRTTSPTQTTSAPTEGGRL